MLDSPVKVLLGSVARTEVVKERSDLAALLALPSALLDESTERRSTCTETGHDNRLSIERG